MVGIDLDIHGTRRAFVLEVPGRIPAIVSGGKSRRNHAPTTLVVFYPLFPERHLQRLVFFTINKTQGPI